MPQLSIIVPVYRVEPYLPKCIESILAQSFSDFELILIDDGSPDRSGEICDAFAAKDGRILVIHQENRGVSAARNAGLDAARGDYLSFIDADDWIQPQMYELMLEGLRSHNADVAVCGMDYRDPGGKLVDSVTQQAASYDRAEMLKLIFSLPNPFGGGCCNKVFRRENMRTLRYPVDVALAEDWYFLYQCVLQANKAVFVPDCLYTVTVREDSATRRDDVGVIVRNIQGGKLFRFHLSLARKHGKQLETVATDRCLDDCMRYANRIREVGMRNGQPWRRPYRRLRLQIAGTLLRAVLRGTVSRQARNRFTMELLRPR